MTGKKLTLETIMLRTKCDKLNSIKSLNLWGNDLEDISCVAKVPNLEIVSLTVNKIKTLQYFSKLGNLRELYMRNNKISSFSEVEYLTNIQSLKSLSLNENPISDNNSNYRLIIINMLPQLIKLDGIIISKEERLMSENVDINDTNNNKDKSFENAEEYIYEYDKENINNKNKEDFKDNNDSIDEDVKSNDNLSNNTKTSYVNSYDEIPIGSKSKSIVSDNNVFSNPKTTGGNINLNKKLSDNAVAYKKVSLIHLLII